MPPSDDELIYDMVDYARLARSFVEGKTFDDVVPGSVHYLALIKAVEIVGEAARGVSTERRANIPDVPWERMVGMRHRLVHGYQKIDRATLWKVATVDIPHLLVILEPLLDHMDLSDYEEPPDEGQSPND